MRFWLRVVQLVVAAEVAAGLWWWGESLHRPVLPMHNPKVLDRLTSRSLDQARSKFSPDRIEDWTRLGELHLVFGSYASAEACYQRALREHPKHVETLLGLGMSQERLGRYAVANETFASLIPLAPPGMRDELRYRMGRNLLRLERAAEAEQAFRDGGNFPPATYQLAKLLVRTDRAAASLPIIESLLRLGPDVMEANQLAEQAYRSLGDRTKAAEHREILERCPNRLATGRTISVFRHIRQQHGVMKILAEASALEQRGQFEEACRLYETVWEVDTGEPYALKAAELRLKLNQPGAALEWCERQEPIGGSSSGLLELRGKIYAVMHQSDEALADWRRSQSLLIRPSVCREMSKMWLSQGETDAARQQEALAEFSDGVRLYRMNRIPQALDHLTKSLALNPENAQTLYYLGQVQRLSGKSSDAIVSWRRCLERQPGHGRAFAALQAASADRQP